MCGICGIYNLNTGKSFDKDALIKMTARLSHRGPDDEGIYVSERVGLGQRRLAIIDRSASAHQPLSNENGSIWLVLNGEIYNYLDLKDDLEGKGHVFKSKSDSEVLIHLYEEESDGFLEKLRGMFVLALWDSNKNVLLVVRDRIGQKPLVYAQKDDVLYFASEIKSLRCIGGIGEEIDANSVLLYFSFKLPIGTQTIFSDIKRLMPGKYMRIVDGEIQIKTYWPPNSFNKAHIDSEHPEKQLFSLLEDTVRSQMVSDVPMGAFLSGGIDSSAIVGLMSNHAQSPIKTFSIVYGNGEKNDADSFFIDKAVKAFKIENKKISFDPKWIDYLAGIVLGMDEPYSGPETLSYFFLCQAARKEVTVVLSGDGGDEVFAGYSGYRNWKAIDRVSRWLGFSGKLNINSALIKSKMLPEVQISDIEKLGLLFLVPASQRRGLRRMFQSRQINSQLFTDKIKNKFEYGVENKFLEEAFVELNKKDFMDSLQLTDLLLHNAHGITWLPDQIGMAHSLETRAPFLDHRLIEFVFSLPSSMRIKGIDNRKYILKKSLENLLPREFLSRKKMGYGESIPYRNFFKNEWNGYVQKRLFSDALEEWGGINIEQLRKLYHENLSGAKDNFETLWAVLILSIWLEKVYLAR